MGSIKIVGLGPGPFGCMSLETWEILSHAETLFFRTAIHPTAEELAKRGIAYKSYDEAYESDDDFSAVYAAIASDIIKQALEGIEVVYAVPGSPMVAERTVQIIKRLADDHGILCEILPAMSFMDLAFNRVGVDPQTGLTLTDAGDVESLPTDLDTGLMITQVYSQLVTSELKISLLERYQADKPVFILRRLGLPDEAVISVPLFELDRHGPYDYLTSVFVPKEQIRQQRFDLNPLVDVMAKLRSPGGCPWDIEQTHASLRRYLVEEVYEVLEAIDEEDADHLCEELGDLLLQIVFHARMAEETCLFSMQDVIERVVEKLVRRHPHVFGDVNVRDAAEVIINWDEIKRRENENRAKSALDGIPKGLPALLRANKIQLKAAKVGFDWDDIESVWAKVAEEMAELREASKNMEKEKIEEELGDLLFAVVNLGRFLAIESEVALNRASNKFIRRFVTMEAVAAQKGLQWKEMNLEKMEELWEEAKAQETLISQIPGG